MCAVKELGEYVSKRAGKDELEAFVLDMGYVEYVLLIKMRIEKSNDVVSVVYVGVEVEQYKEENPVIYLFRKTSSSIPYASPTAKIAGEGEVAVKRTFGGKILNWFKEGSIAPYLTLLKSMNRVTPDEVDVLKKTGETITENSKRILEDLIRNYRKLNSGGVAISLIFEDDGGSTHHLGEVEVYREIVKEIAKTRYYKKYKTVSKARDKACSVCGENHREVFGFVTDIFPFYTLDKAGFAPDFDRSAGWKLYPVCYDCANCLEFGKRYLDDKLNLEFYGGFPFYLIPKFLWGVNEETVGIIERWRDPTFSEQGKKGSSLKNLFSDEDEIISELSNLGNYVTFNFLFYKKEKTALRILLSVTDVLPSRLRRLYELKLEMDEVSLFKDSGLRFNFKLLRAIFPSEDKIGVFDNYFIDTAGKIIMGKRISFHFLIKSIVDRIRESFANLRVASNLSKEYSIFRKTVLGHFMFLKFVSKLGLLNTDMEVKEVMSLDKESIQGSMESKLIERVEIFFSENQDFFSTPVKMGVFLLGVLTQKLLDIQYRDRRATPFMCKLNGLKLSQRQIAKLLPEVQGKLEEYGKNYYRNLEDKISGYLVEAGDKWNLNNDLISLCFVMGMNLSRRFKSKSKDREIEPEEGEEQ
nr:TIGR02556 family CRISPR-associated protein [Candidatus Freyarchaeota archaeon]